MADGVVVSLHNHSYRNAVQDMRTAIDVAFRSGVDVLCVQGTGNSNPYDVVRGMPSKFSGYSRASREQGISLLKKTDAVVDVLRGNEVVRLVRGDKILTQDGDILVVGYEGGQIPDSYCMGFPFIARTPEDVAKSDDIPLEVLFGVLNGRDAHYSCRLGHGFYIAPHPYDRKSGLVKAGVTEDMVADYGERGDKKLVQMLADGTIHTYEAFNTSFELPDVLLLAHAAAKRIPLFGRRARTLDFTINGKAEELYNARTSDGRSLSKEGITGNDLGPKYVGVNTTTVMMDWNDDPVEFLDSLRTTLTEGSIHRIRNTQNRCPTRAFIDKVRHSRSER